MSDTSLVRLINLFDNKVRAGVTLIILFVLILGLYFIWALQRMPPQLDWDHVVRLQPGAFLELIIDIPALQRQYRADATSEAVERAENYMFRVRDNALEQRRQTYARTAILACEVASWDHTSPSIFAALSRNQFVTVPVDGGERSLKVRCDELLPPQSETEDTLLRSTPPKRVLDWVEKIGEQLPNRSLEAIETDLHKLVEFERDIVENARNYVRSLSSGLSFGFLYAKKYEWLVHLLVWSWAGVIMAGFARLVLKIQNREPFGLSFVFVSLRFFTAPIIALVFVATISYGLTSESIALHHQPMFLIFAFASGYFSESFNLMLRKGLNSILPSFGINAARVSGAADLKTAVRNIQGAPSFESESPESLSGLKVVLDRSIKRVGSETTAAVADGLRY